MKPAVILILLLIAAMCAYGYMQTKRETFVSGGVNPAYDGSFRTSLGKIGPIQEPETCGTCA